jgi:hypothetical protein
VRSAAARQQEVGVDHMQRNALTESKIKSGTCTVDPYTVEHYISIPPSPDAPT